MNSSLTIYLPFVTNFYATKLRRRIYLKIKQTFLIKIPSLLVICDFVLFYLFIAFYTFLIIKVFCILVKAWLNEKFSPELQETKVELVECILEQVTGLVRIWCVYVIVMTRLQAQSCFLLTNNYVHFHFDASEHRFHLTTAYSYL